MNEKCDSCDLNAIWVRQTQFAGDHFFCMAHAIQEDDFYKEDVQSTFFWTRIEEYRSRHA